MLDTLTLAHAAIRRTEWDLAQERALDRYCAKNGIVRTQIKPVCISCGQRKPLNEYPDNIGIAPAWLTFRECRECI